MSSVKATLKDEVRPDGTQPIRIRVTVNRKVNYFNTGLAVSTKHWNPRATFDKQNWIKASYLDNGKYNTRIHEFTEELLDLTHEMPALSASELVDLYKRRRQGKEAKEETAHESLVSYIEREMRLIKPRVKFRTYDRYLRYFERLKDFCADMPVSGVTLTLVKKLESHLMEKNERSTVNKELEFLKSMLRRAVAEGVIEFRDNPFNGYKLPPAKRTHKEKLTEEEIAALEDLPLPYFSNLWHARNSFMLQYCLAGARIGDVLTLKWSGVSDTRVTYFEMKGERHGKRHSVLITDRLRKVLDAYRSEVKYRYVLPFMEAYALMENKPEHEEVFFNKMESATTRINRALVKMAKMAGIEKKVSTHVSRHSFADKLRRGGDLYAASKLLGHTSLKQTENYFQELDEEAQDEALKRALEG